MARRPGRPRGRRRPARRPRGVGRLQPALDGRPALGGRRSSTGSRRSSPVTTCPTRGSSGPASRATAAWPARRTGWSPREDLLRRSHEHTALLAELADAGHRLGMRVWLARREQTRRIDGELARRPARRPRAARLPRRHQPGVGGARATSTASGTSAARWRSCSRSSGPRCWASRCCAATTGSRPTTRSSASSSSRPERTELVRYKLDRSPLLRDRARDRRLQHHQVEPPAPRSSAAEQPDLADLEPLLGLDPIDRAPRRPDAALRRLTRRGVSQATWRPSRRRGTLSSPVAACRA